MLQRIVVILLFFHLLSFCEGQSIPEKKYVAEGFASFYAEDFDGKKTANGEIFNMSDYTAAHPTLAFGTYLRVTNIKNNYSIVVRVNDRGPFVKNRIIDLTEAAARRIGSYMHGVTPVKVEEINLLQLTPELDSIFNTNSVVDCLGNVDKLSGFNLSLWSSNDLIHVLYIANDLYLKEDFEKVYIVTKGKGTSKKYHVVISEIEDRVLANQLKDYFERQGFMHVSLLK